MVKDIQDIQMKRFRFLHRLYEVTEGSEQAFVNFQQLGDELGFSHAETDKIDDYLRGEGLITHVSLGGSISITHRGIIEVEAALSKPDEPTTYFPAVNIVHVEQMIDSQIQQGTNQSSQVLTFSTNDLEAIAKFIDNMKGQLDELKLDEEIQAEAISDIETLETQIKSPRPKHAIIKECMLSLRRILEDVAGNAAAAMLIQNIITLMK
jgi:hypothetical protein